jgi:hypothetical protein
MRMDEFDPQVLRDARNEAIQKFNAHLYECVKKEFEAAKEEGRLRLQFILNGDRPGHTTIKTRDFMRTSDVVEKLEFILGSRYHILTTGEYIDASISSS